jgi:hypothetical protein
MCASSQTEPASREHDVVSKQSLHDAAQDHGHLSGCEYQTRWFHESEQPAVAKFSERLDGSRRLEHEVALCFA